jgi:hypothetical protein
MHAKKIGMHEQKAMNTPIKMEDFEIASQLMDPDGKVQMISILRRMCELKLAETDIVC